MGVALTNWITALGLLLASPAFGEPTPKDLAAIEQVQLPALEGRLAAARARVAAREDFAAGNVAFESAYVDIEPNSLGDARVLKGRLGLLDDAAVERALEASNVPSDLPARVLARLSASQKGVWATEESADTLERHMLTAVLASLSKHPELSAASDAPRRSALQGAVDLAREEAKQAADAEGRASAQRVLAKADATLRHHDLMMSALRLVPAGGAPPGLRPLLVEASSAVDYSGAASALRLARPFLTGAKAKRVDGALVAVAGRELAAALVDRDAAVSAMEEPLPELASAAEGQLALEAAVQRLDASMARAEILPEAVYPGDEDRTKAMAYRLQTLELQRERADAVLWSFESSHQQDAVAGEGPKVASQTEAEAAKQRATEAKEQAEDARGRRVADLLNYYAVAQARGVELGPRADKAAEALSTAKNTWVTSLGTIRDKTTELEQRSALENKAKDADDQHDAVRELLSTLRGSGIVTGKASITAEALVAKHRRDVEEDRSRVQQGQALLDSLEPDAKTELSATLERWTEALDDEERLLTSLAGNLHEARDIGLRTLKDARLSRRALEPYISSAQHVKDRGNFIGDIRQQLALLPSGVWMMTRDRWATLLELPGKFSDYNVLRSLVSNSAWTLGLLVVWWWGRSQVGALAMIAAQRVRKWRPELRMTDVAALKEPTTRFLRNVIDLALGYALIWSLEGSLGEITFLLSIYLQLSLFRAVLAAFDLLVIRSEEVRPAFAVLRADMHALARITVRAFAAYWVLSGFVEFLLWDVLALDTISALSSWAMSWVFWGMLAWALWQWQPYLRERIERFSKSHPAVAWLARDDGNPLFRIPRAVGSAFFFLAQGSVDLLYRGARDGSSLSWLLNLVNRYRLEDDHSEVVRVWSEEERLEFVHADVKDKSILDREDTQVQISGALAEWKRTRKRGLVAVVGDRGAGKRTACDRIQATMESAGLSVATLELDDRITEEGGLLAWLSEQAGVGPCSTPDELILALDELEPQGFIIRGVHWTFERRVGGMAAIGTLLYVLNATSDRHFWALSVHGPAWDWFDSVGCMVDTGVFRLVCRLPPLTSSQLRALTISRLGSMGLSVDFSALVRSSAFGTDPEIELERATAVFYRLLAEASSGNPTIAMHMFARCVQLTDNDRVVKTRMSSALSGSVIEDLSEAALFVLVALRLQDSLSLAEAVDVTNLTLASVRTTVRDLVSRGLVERNEEHLQVPDDALQSVTRTLRRRHFLHLGAA